MLKELNIIAQGLMGLQGFRTDSFIGSANESGRTRLDLGSGPTVTDLVASDVVETDSKPDWRSAA